MKFLFASDSFKGTLSSREIAGLLTTAARKVFPGCVCVEIPVADGGEGTLDAVLAVKRGVRRTVRVQGPLLEPVDATYGILDGGAAVIEMAAASGLPLVPPERRDPLLATSVGTGELIRDALEQGCREIAVTIGGSATNDGGMGALAALGVRFLDGEGRALAGCGGDLEKVRRIDCAGLHPLAKSCHFTAMCDVKNSLTGPDGATYTFGVQKGAAPEILDRLECGMEHYARIVAADTGLDAAPMAGSGAAGGLGFALRAFLDAALKPGIETVLDLIGFDALLADIDLVVTGEGRIDRQSAFGKVPSGIARRCKKRGVPVVAIVGGIGEGAEAIYEHGVDSIVAAVCAPMELSEACARATELYSAAAERTFRLLKAGRALRG